MKERLEKEIEGLEKVRAVTGGICAVSGVTANGIHCGLKPGGEPDLALFHSDTPLKTAGFYTKNKLLGAHIPVFRKTLHASRGNVRSLLVNSKIANCATGDRGEMDNLMVCSTLAGKLGIRPGQVLFASTGVIGKRLPVDTITDGLDGLTGGLSSEGGESAARAIMTTDTLPKSCAVEIQSENGAYRIAGVAKGSGMIFPDMATMFGFIFTDADILLPALRSVAKKCVNSTFNCISVDGDTSPNDTVLAMANGASGAKVRSKKEKDAFAGAMAAVMRYLSKELVRDGEGATKFVDIRIEGAAGRSDARAMAHSIANSQLVKTAIFGSDPNWGRIISAAAVSGAKFDPALAVLSIDGECVYDRGRLPDSTGEIMKNKDVCIVLDAGLGSAATSFWTCDLTYDYVKINAEYTT